MQVDLFFYREPEESKEQQEEEAPATADYADYTGGALGGISDQWSGQIPDGQWGDAVAPAIPAVPGVTWTSDGECDSLTINTNSR